MTTVFPFFGETEIEVLAVVGSFLLLITHGITAACTREKVVVSTRWARLFPSHHTCSPYLRRSNKNFTRELREIWDNLFSLPPVIRQIVRVSLPRELRI